jgi:hypothetical protein
MPCGPAPPVMTGPPTSRGPLHNPADFYTIPRPSTQSRGPLHNPMDLYTIPRPSTQSRSPLHNPAALYTIPWPSPLSFGPCHHHAAQAAICFFYSAALRPSLEGGNVAAENVRASREKNPGIDGWQICQPVTINMCRLFCVFSRVPYFVE